MENIRFVLTAFAVILISGCGVSSLNYNLEVAPLDLVQNSSKAIWHDGNEILNVNAKSNEKASVFVEPLLMLEDGSYYKNVLVAKPQKESPTIYGIYQIDIPDADKIKFRAKVGYSYQDNPLIGTLVFRLSVQEENEFPVLAEVEAPYDGDLKTLETDLTPYRGRFKFLILSVQAKGENSNLLEGIWLEPKISYEFF